MTAVLSPARLGHAPPARLGHASSACLGHDALARLVRDCAASGVARHALMLRLAPLPAQLLQPHHLRLLESVLDPLAVLDRARLFHLPGIALVATWRGDAAAPVVRQARATLRHLLDDAPADLPSAEALLVPFHLPAEGEALLRACAEDASLLAPAATGRDEGVPLDPAALAALETALARADLARFARRRTVFRLTPDGPAPAWEERAISVAELGAELAPGRALTADPWLFRRLARTLERRMLALLAAPGELDRAGPFGLAVSAAGLLSPEFLRFDAALPARLRGGVVLGLLPADILSDPASFLLARDYAKSRGHRLLLREVDPPLLPVLGLRRLEMDHLQLRWGPETASVGAEVLASAAEPGQVVLAGADGPEALDWARGRGIGFLQGRAAA